MNKKNVVIIGPFIINLLEKYMNFELWILPKPEQATPSVPMDYDWARVNNKVIYDKLKIK